MNADGSPPIPWGLVMAGGESRRMGMPKADLVRGDGTTWLQHAADLLNACCERVWISVREHQRSTVPKGFEVIVDRYSGLGPAAGLMSAWDLFPDRPWLVLATDMPHVTVALLERLLRARTGAAIATGFSHADGVAEPLCTVWEPEAAELLRSAARTGKVSLSRLMAQATVNWVPLEDPGLLESVNTPSQKARWDAEGGNPGPRSGRSRARSAPLQEKPSKFIE